MRFVDLHLHTRYSDGSWTPEDLCKEAMHRQLSAIAITDHDTLDGVPPILAVSDRLGIEVIPGVEITCRIETTEVHLLAYLPGATWQDPALTAVLNHSKQIREKRIGEMVTRINDLGIPVTEAEVLACSDCGTLGRPHMAMALVKRGVVKTSDEAFERFLKRGKPGFVDRYRMTTAEAIGHVKRAGGVAVLAHPALNKVDEHLAELAQQGLGGLEIWHTRHSPGQTEHYRRLAARLGLIVTGGSDCHGTVRGRALIGTVQVPYECVDAIKAAAQ
ncbi:MAG: 5'-3' exoribonuclease [Verrucomicrobiae bacterium]|nr:5'-3' exoribonuclease [Verrucomicrobiae bacterium]